jgi:hypothetical protein
MKEKIEIIIDELYDVFYLDALSIKEAYESGDMLGSQPHIDCMFSDINNLIILSKDEFIEKLKTDEFRKFLKISLF